MPVKLTSLCISSTYDILRSPSNLKRWKLTSEASCFLSNKDTWTGSHILGAFKVALSKRRFTFHHDNVLRIIINNIRSLIKNMKFSVPTLKQPMKIKFVKKWTRVKTKVLLPMGYYIKCQTGSCWWYFFFFTSHSFYRMKVIYFKQFNWMRILLSILGWVCQGFHDEDHKEDLVQAFIPGEWTILCFHWSYWKPNCTVQLYLWITELCGQPEYYSRYRYEP